MALDSKLVQNINLQANGDQLLKPLEAFGREINKTIRGLTKLSETMSAGGHANEDSLRRQTQLLQRLIGEASTLQNVLSSSSNKRRDGLLSGLDEQRLGKSTLSASKLKRELGETKTVTDALEVRLALLNKRFAELGQTGRALSKTDIAKAFNTEGAIQQVRKLEREIAKLDAAAKSGNGLSTGGQKLRTALQSRMGTLLENVQNVRTDPKKFAVEIAGVERLAAEYKNLARAELEAARAADQNAQAQRRTILNAVNQGEAQLRSTLQRGASKYSFTPDQARNSDQLALGKTIEGNIQRLQQMQQVMSRAVAPGTEKSQAAIDRLQAAWNRVSSETSKALAMRKAYDGLPEVKRGNLLGSIFGSKESLLASAGVTAGFMGISAAIGAVTNTVQAGVRAVTEFDDSMAKLQAISGSTDQQMVKLSGSIQEVARNSKYSTQEIADSATQIAQAGFTANETAEVLKNALALATGSGSTPAEAVDTLTSSLGAFNLQATESQRVADTLMQGLNDSKLAMNQMQAAIQYAGATAQENGVKFEELTAIAGSLANAGIRSGSTIGTGIRQLLVDLKTPTDDFKKELQGLGLTMADVDVKSKGLAQVVKNLSDAGFSAEQAYASFEVRAASAFLAFRGQLDTYDQMSLSLARTGAAAEAQERAMGSLSAKWQTFKNLLGEFAVDNSGTVVTALKLITDGVNGLFGMFVETEDSVSGMGMSWTTFVPILGQVTTGINALGDAVYGAAGHQEKLKTASNEAEEAMRSQRQTISSIEDAIGDLISRSSTLQTNQVAMQAEVLTLSTRFKGLSTELQGAAANYDNVLAAMQRLRNYELAQSANKSQQVFDAKNGEAVGIAAQMVEHRDSARQIVVPASRGKNPTVAGAARTLLGSLNGNAIRMNGSELQGEYLRLDAAEQELRRLNDQSAGMQRLIGAIQKQKDLISQLAAVKGERDLASQQMYLARQLGGPAGSARQGVVDSFTSGINNALLGNEDKAHSQDQALKALVDRMQSQIKLWQTAQRAAKTVSEQSALSGSISSLQALVARANRETRVTDEEEGKAKTPKDHAGRRLSADQVAAEIKRLVPRANITDTTRPASRQAGYDRAAGIKRDPNSAPHVNGTALDMAPIPGMNPMEIVAILEGMGLRVTGGPVHAPGVRYIPVNHGTGPHWHFQWAAKLTSVERAANTDAEKQAREIQQLVEARASQGAKTQSAKITRITNEAKAGSRPIGDLTSDMNTALKDYETAELAAFDAAHPSAGQSKEAIELAAMQRAELVQTLKEKTAGFFAQFWRYVSDAAGKILDAGLAQGKQAAEDATYAADAPVRAAAQQGAILGNRTNRNNVDAGMRWRQEREAENAQNTADTNKASILGGQALGASLQLEEYRRKVETLIPKSEEWNAAQEKVRDTETRINEILRERQTLLDGVTARTARVAEPELGQRLRDSANAWRENSGALDSWAKIAGDSVGPMADQLAGSMTDFFTSVISGQESFGGALVKMLASFAQFVMQMIMRALALQAVNAILSALGMGPVPGSYEGGKVQTPASSSSGSASAGMRAYNGGPVVVPGRFGGGISHLGSDLGGRINRGSPARDSALYNLAEGEFVMRNKSVKDLGLPFMENINKHGRKGLEKMAGAGSAFTNVQMPKQETNVFVVQEKQAPAMGPSDVLVTIARDIMSNGPTKKLIKQVAQGG
jgi:TP901 family phage tail tape measure protein